MKLLGTENNCTDNYIVVLLKRVKNRSNLILIATSHSSNQRCGAVQKHKPQKKGRDLVPEMHEPI